MDALGQQPGRIPLPQQNRQPQNGDGASQQRPQVGRSRSNQMLSSTVIKGSAHHQANLGSPRVWAA